MFDFEKVMDLLYSEEEPDMSDVKEVKMNAYDDIIVYKDGTERVIYHCCD